MRRYKCYFELLCSYPQDLQIIISFPQMYPTRPVNWSQSLLSSLCIPNPMVNKVTNQHQDQSDRNIPTLSFYLHTFSRCPTTHRIITPAPSEQQNLTSWFERECVS